MATNSGATPTEDNFVHLENETDIANAFEQFWKEQDALDADAQKKFPRGFVAKKPYLRVTPSPLAGEPAGVK